MSVIPNAPSSPIADELLTVRDYLRFAVSRFAQAGLAYGHGTSNSFDDAAFLILETLKLPVDRLEPFLDARLTAPERHRVIALIDERVTTRKPSAYLLGICYLQGLPFHVDERVIVPRSFIAELLMSDVIVGEDGLIGDPLSIERVLDLCTGSASLAVIAAEVFANAEIDGVDLSPEALVVARLNVAESGHAGRISLFESDLFASLERRNRYDLILSNPPYVRDDSMATLPPEYLHEPSMALAGGPDGLHIVRRIVAEAGRHLLPDGTLICEVGGNRDALEAAFPALPFVWLDTEQSRGEVFWLRARDLLQE